jgi:hypothetical protein
MNNKQYYSLRTLTVNLSIVLILQAGLHTFLIINQLNSIEKNQKLIIQQMERENVLLTTNPCK